jgi:hypothetical protein
MQKPETYILKAVFWDSPEFLNERKIRNVLIQGNDEIKKWIMTRFLEYGRVIDSLSFFTIQEISNKINDLKLRDFTRKNGKG